MQLTWRPTFFEEGFYLFVFFSVSECHSENNIGQELLKFWLKKLFSGWGIFKGGQKGVNIQGSSSVSMAGPLHVLSYFIHIHLVKKDIWKFICSEGPCIGFLLLLQQITTNLITLNNTHLLFFSSGGQKSKMSLIGLCPGVSRAVPLDALKSVFLSFLAPKGDA